MIGIIIGIAVAWISYWLSGAPPELSYIARSATILEGLSKDISIFYKDKRAFNLRKANYIFWNSGRKVILNRDVPSASPMRISIPTGGNDSIDLLDVYVCRVSRSDNQAFAQRLSGTESHIVEISFEYLDPSHGFNVELIFQCKGEVKLPPASGKVIGMKGDLRKYPKYLETRNALIWTFAVATAAAVNTVTIVLMGWLNPIIAVYSIPPGTPVQQYKMITEVRDWITLKLLLLFFASLWLSLRCLRVFRSNRNVPNDLVD